MKVVLPGGAGFVGRNLIGVMITGFEEGVKKMEDFD